MTPKKCKVHRGVNRIRAQSSFCTPTENKVKLQNSAAHIRTFRQPAGLSFQQTRDSSVKLVSSNMEQERGGGARGDTRVTCNLGFLTGKPVQDLWDKLECWWNIAPEPQISSHLQVSASSTHRGEAAKSSTDVSPTSAFGQNFN